MKLLLLWCSFFGVLFALDARANLFCPTTEYDGTPSFRNLPIDIPHHLLSKDKPFMENGRIACLVESDLAMGSNIKIQIEKGEILGHSYIIKYHNKTAIIQYDTHKSFDRDPSKNYFVQCRRDGIDQKNICWMRIFNLVIGLNKHGDWFLNSAITPHDAKEFNLIYRNPDSSAKIIRGYYGTGLTSDQVSFFLDHVEENALVSINFDASPDASGFHHEFSVNGIQEIIKIITALYHAKQ